MAKKDQKKKNNVIPFPKPRPPSGDMEVYIDFEADFSDEIVLKCECGSQNFLIHLDGCLECHECGEIYFEELDDDTRV